jgi:hypothetical protein
MNETDAVRRFLSERGCTDDVVEGGLEGLVSGWEHTVGQVGSGYPLGLDDYLNDLDGRQLLEEALALAPWSANPALMKRLSEVDARMKALVVPAPACLWGEAVAEAEGWSAEHEWWYFSLPRSPGPVLREDLEAF